MDTTPGAETTTRVFRQSGEWYVESRDPLTPAAHIDQGHAGCPRCGARIRLRETSGTGAPPQRLTGSEWQEHYYQEHTLPDSDGYTITLAASKGGDYHISHVDNHQDLAVQPPRSYKPICGARATQRPTAWSEPAPGTLAETRRRFTKLIHDDLTCTKCKANAAT